MGDEVAVTVAVVSSAARGLVLSNVWSPGVVGLPNAGHFRLVTFIMGIVPSACRFGRPVLTVQRIAGC